MEAKELIETSKQVIEGDHLDIDNYVAAERLARHILDTVNEDDDEFIDSTWMAKNFPKYEVNKFGKKAYLVCKRLFCMLESGAWTIRVEGWGVYIGAVQTRGQLRRIIKDLSQE